MIESERLLHPTQETLRLLKRVKTVLIDAKVHYTEIMNRLKYEAKKEANRPLYASVRSDEDQSYAKRFLVIRSQV